MKRKLAAALVLSVLLASFGAGVAGMLGFLVGLILGFLSPFLVAVKGRRR